jgi:hypothetical protein
MHFFYPRIDLTAAVKVLLEKISLLMFYKLLNYVLVQVYTYILIKKQTML